MSAAEIAFDRYPGTDTISLAGLQTGVVMALGSLGCPVELADILNTLPADCRQSFDLHAKNVGFPGKSVDRPHHAFFEHHFLRFGGMITYVYGESNGFTLSQVGHQHYRAIMGMDD